MLPRVHQLPCRNIQQLEELGNSSRDQLPHWLQADEGLGYRVMGVKGL